MNGSTAAASAVTVSGGRLGGTGTIGGAVTVGAAGNIGAGASVGSMRLQNGLDLSAGGTNVWELAAESTSNPGTNFDQMVLTGGTLTLGGAATLSLQFVGAATAPDSSDPFWQESRTWQIISATNVVSNFAAIENGDHPAGSFSTSVDTNGVWLMFTPSSPRPRITAISGAGTGGVTVSYTNTLPGTNYVLSYSTNLGVMNWFAAGNKTAAGASDSQTDGTATNSQRHYRVHYSTP